MKKFICTACGAVWYSAATANKPCEKCNGKLAEINLNNKEPKLGGYLIK